MSRRNAVTVAIEKVKSEIEFQRRLLDALEATQKAQSTTKRTRKPAAPKPPDSAA